MFNKLFVVLAFSTFVTVAYFVSLTVFSKNICLTPSVPITRQNISSLIEEAVQRLWDKKNRVSNVSREKAQVKDTPKPVQVATATTLGPCPDSSLKLKGPLHVEFNTQRTLDGVRAAVGADLQEGGRYKPKNCIARQKVAVIIPFRHRDEHLKHWLYYLHPILQRQQLDYGVYIINQYGEGVFNRAKLMNVGYAESVKEYDYGCFVFSDIDLVPMDDRNLYQCFDNPRHLAVAMDKFNFGLPYGNFFGGVSALSKSQFLRINGFPNTYWGWGGEDDDIFNRIKIRGMSISRPDLMIGKYRMVKHQRDKHNEANPENPGKLRETGSKMDQDGISSLKYTVKSIVKDRLFTNITVDIQAPAS